MKVTLTFNSAVEVKIPRIPNFILLENGDKMSIHQFTSNELKLIGKAFTKNLILKARQ